MKRNTVAYASMLRDEIVAAIKNYWPFFLIFALFLLLMTLRILPAGELKQVSGEVMNFGASPGAAGAALLMTVQLDSGGTVTVGHDSSYRPGDSIVLEVVPKYFVSDTYRVAR